MAAAIQQMGFAHFNTQESDVDSWLDFSAADMHSPATKPNAPALSRMPSSTLTSPAMTVVPLDGSDEFQVPAKPSHEYERFKQQTGLPSGSVPGLNMASNSFSGFSNSGIGMEDSSLMGNWGTGIGMDDFNMDATFGSSTMPAFFFPSAEASSSSSSQQSDFVNPANITQPEDAPTNVRVWPGMHQQQAALAKAQQQAQQQRHQQQAQQQQQQHQQQQQRSQPSRRSASHTPTDALTEETIARVVNQIRQESRRQSQQDVDDLDNLPHIARMKKDEEDMDEDERLLASDEGKKLSSKERRQLRNKVSARAFRSRRKEYIGQLEGEVAGKAQECNDLRVQNRALMDENARSRAFIEKLLRHPAFTPFLEDLSRDESLQTRMPAPAAPAPAPQAAPQQFQNVSQSENVHVGMTLIPETPVDLSMLNLNGSWSSQNLGFPYTQPQVFAVTEVPQGPINPIDTSVLSGKGYEAVMSQEETVEAVKPDYPVIERAAPAAMIVEAPKPAETEEDREFDNNPAFALYHASPATSPVSTVSPPPSFDRLAFSSKQSPQFELVVSCKESPESAMARVERLCASMDIVLERIQSMTS